MKFYKRFIAAIVLMTLFSSCDKYLDVQPKGVVIPTTLDDYQALLSAPLSVSRTAHNIFHATDEIVLPASLRIAATGGIGIEGKSGVNAYDFKNEIYDVTEDDADWNSAYSSIYVFNTVLLGLETNKESDVQKKNQLKGEALVHRAFTYLILVNEYAKHYSASANTDLGVPMPLKPDINALLPRSTVNAVYQQIEKDLLEAADILPETSSYNYRPNKAAAFGVLARMYLYTGNWAKAYEYANKAFQLSHLIYDFNSITYLAPANRVTSQIIGYPANAVDMKSIVFFKYFRKVRAFNYNYVMSDDQYALFSPGDLRETFGATDKNFFGVTLPGMGILESQPAYSYYNGGITTQELILTRAEASARTGKLSDALADLNTLRKKRFTPATYVDLQSSDATEVLNLVLRERRIELAFTGLRLADIKRLNLEGRNISIKHGTVTVGPNDPRIVFPIPSKIISLNPNIIQNVR